jgi:uridylate kinase
MDTTCISLSGGIISTESGVNKEFAKELAQFLAKYSKKHKFILVVGGGYSSRLYVSSTKDILENNNSLLDQIAIAFTRINALILKDVLSLANLNVYQNVATSLEELRMAISSNDIVVLGGLIPGMSTDAVSVLACEVMNSKLLLNISSIAYLYDKPPVNKDAKPLPRLTHDKLLELAYTYDTRVAGSNFLFDFFASKLAKRANIEVRFVRANIKEVEQAFKGEEYPGSIVK